MTTATFRDFHSLDQARSVAYTVTYYDPAAPTVALSNPAPQSVAANTHPADVTGPDGLDELYAKGPENELYALVRQGAPVSDQTARETPSVSSMNAAIASTAATKQPIDSDLTAIAALSTTAFGRALLAAVDGPALLAAAGAEASDSDLIAIASLATTAYGRGLLTVADAAAFTTLLRGLLDTVYAPHA